MEKQRPARKPKPKRGRMYMVIGGMFHKLHQWHIIQWLYSQPRPMGRVIGEAVEYYFDNVVAPTMSAAEIDELKGERE